VDAAGRRELDEPESAVTVAATEPQSAEPIVRLRGVGRRFGGVHAVRDVDLDVYPGERRALLGPNGAGKTTLFNVISGEFPPTGGSVELFGRDVTTMPARTRAKLGLTRTFQTSRLFLGLTVEDNLYLAALGARGGHLRPVRLPGRDGPLRERARELAERVGLEQQLGTVVGSLSHGEQRQLEVGMARAGDPKIMMLDEPAAGLSRGERVLLTDLLLTLGRDITLIVIEHDMDVVFRYSDRIVMMHEGRFLADGTPDEIKLNKDVANILLGVPLSD
jgi:branched-chain amino acid transport system ATP-binding protein